MKKRHYSTEFKLEAVRLSYKRDNIKDLANELGVQVQRIYKWRATHREISSLTVFSKKQEAKLAVFEYIEIWYNRKRLHSSLNYKTPKEVELEFNKLKYVA